MTNGKSISQQKSYRQGNSHVELYPLNSDENEPLEFVNDSRNKMTESLDSIPRLDSVHDENFTFGPDAIKLAGASLNNNFMFADQAMAEAFERPILQPSNDSNINSQQLNLPVNNNNSQNVNSTLELKKQRRKNKELKEKAMKIEVEKMPGFFGDGSIDEIMKLLEPERILLEKADKKKRKKGGGAKKNKVKKVPEMTLTLMYFFGKQTSIEFNYNLKSSETGDIDVEVELDNDYSPVQNGTKELSPKSTENKSLDVEDSNLVKTKETSIDNEETVSRSPIETNGLSNDVTVNEDDKKDREVLHAAWNDFLQKYEGKIYVHDDDSNEINTQEFITTKKRSNLSNAQKNNNTSNNRRDRKARR